MRSAFLRWALVHFARKSLRFQFFYSQFAASFCGRVERAFCGFEHDGSSVSSSNRLSCIRKASFLY
jgi:hypothetical protein